MLDEDGATVTVGVTSPVFRAVVAETLAL